MCRRTQDLKLFLVCFKFNNCLICLDPAHAFVTASVICPSMPRTAPARLSVVQLGRIMAVEAGPPPCLRVADAWRVAGYWPEAIDAPRGTGTAAPPCLVHRRPSPRRSRIILEYYYIHVDRIVRYARRASALVVRLYYLLCISLASHPQPQWSADPHAD